MDTKEDAMDGIPRKSSIKMDSGVSDRTRRTSSAKSVTIDPVPNTTYYLDARTHCGREGDPRCGFKVIW